MSLADNNGRVLVVDWDLDAPGLHRFFPSASLRSLAERPGLINYFADVRKQLNEDRSFAQSVSRSEDPGVLEERVPLDKYIITDAAPRIDLMTAGRLGCSYQQEVLNFGWKDFHRSHANVFRLFRELLVNRYRFCFIDSRTGYTDISGICTALMPEKLVAVFVPNQQNLDGILAMVSTAVEYRRTSDDSRPLSVFPVPSRIDRSEQAELHSWLLRFQEAFEKLFSSVYATECDLTRHFDTVQLPHVAYYSYGERIAVLDEDRSKTGSLRNAYEVFADRLINSTVAWDPDPGSGMGSS
jgi:hypothetical protein